MVIGEYRTEWFGVESSFEHFLLIVNFIALIIVLNSKWTNLVPSFKKQMDLESLWCYFLYIFGSILVWCPTLFFPVNNKIKTYKTNVTVPGINNDLRILIYFLMLFAEIIIFELSSFSWHGNLHRACERERRFSRNSLLPWKALKLNPRGPGEPTNQYYDKIVYISCTCITLQKSYDVFRIIWLQFNYLLFNYYNLILYWFLSSFYFIERNFLINVHIFTYIDDLNRSWLHVADHNY